MSWIAASNPQHPRPRSHSARSWYFCGPAGADADLKGFGPPHRRTGFRSSRLLGRGLQPPRLIANADQEHQLLGVLEQVDDAVPALLQVDRLAVGQQVYFRFARERIAPPLAHLPLQVA